MALFSGAATRSVIWNGLGDRNLQQSWVEGPRLGKGRYDPSAAGGKSGTYVAYVQRRARHDLYVRRLRSSGRFGRATRVARRDPADFMVVQAPKGNMAIVYPWSDDAWIIRSRKGTRWSGRPRRRSYETPRRPRHVPRSRRLFRGNGPGDLRAVLGGRGGWVVWDGEGGNAGSHPIRIAALPGAPRR